MAERPAFIDSGKVIDMHAHFASPDVLSQTYETSTFARNVAQKSQSGKASPLPAKILEQLTDERSRFLEMDRMGVDIQVVSPSIIHQCTYEFDIETALAIDRSSNRSLVDLIARHPDRLSGLGSLPMQDVDVSCRELEFIVNELGLKGGIIGSFINGMELGDPYFRPFWQHASDLGAVVFIHPSGNTDPRLAKHRLLISVGQPLEETLAMSSLVYEGVIDALPSLKIVFAHGGGYLPFYTGRHDQLYRAGQAGENMKSDFSGYLDRFFYDAVLFNDDQLSILSDRVGPDRILLGSDFPFAEKDPVRLLQRAKNIADNDKKNIVGKNAEILFGI